MPFERGLDRAVRARSLRARCMPCYARRCRMAGFLRGIVELAPSRASKDDRSSHRLRRSAIDAFTSSQETTSFGFAS
jgi:hypothetical protein